MSCGSPPWQFCAPRLCSSPRKAPVHLESRACSRPRLRLRGLAGAAHSRLVRLRQFYGASRFGPPAWRFSIDPDVFVGRLQSLAQAGFEYLRRKEVLADVVGILTALP